MATTFSSLVLPSEMYSTRRDKHSLVSFPKLDIFSNSVPITCKPTFNKGCSFIVEAAWTRRSQSELDKRPNRKSWKQRTDMYMRPFLLDLFFSRRFIQAKVMHRPSCKVVSVATTNAKDLRNTLPSLTDYNACRIIGKLIAERAMDADVFAMSYEPRKGERIEGRIKVVIDAIQEFGIIFV